MAEHYKPLLGTCLEGVFLLVKPVEIAIKPFGSIVEKRNNFLQPSWG
jgi:hypothetical protein